MSMDDPLGLAARLAALDRAEAGWWRLRDANDRAHRRNDDRIVAGLRAVQAERDDLRAAQQAQASADRALDRAAREGRAA